MHPDRKTSQNNSVNDITAFRRPIDEKQSELMFGFCGRTKCPMDAVCCNVDREGAVRAF
jgi:hypothetical protein